MAPRDATPPDAISTDAIPPQVVSGPPLRALLDTNIVLDLFLQRDPWSTEAQPMWEARDQGRLLAYMAASALTDIFYICRKQVGIERAKGIVQTCLTGFTIVPVDRDLLERALALPGSDFEDNVQISSALAAGVDLIVSRNTADFKYASLPAVTPLDILSHLPPSIP